MLITMLDIQHNLLLSNHNYTIQLLKHVHVKSIQLLPILHPNYDIMQMLHQTYNYYVEYEKHVNLLISKHVLILLVHVDSNYYNQYRHPIKHVQYDTKLHEFWRV
jgi:predicted methyltransferase